VTNTNGRHSSVFTMVAFIVIVPSLVALILAINAYSAEDSFVAMWLILLGLFGVVIGGYLLYRRRLPFQHILLPQQTVSKACIQCGRPIPDISKFCPYCRTKQTKEVAVAEQKQEIEKENASAELKPKIEAKEFPEPEAQEKPPFYCRYCGAENKVDAVFCERCGKRIS